ncbi:hypothetical protein PanWU01x14_304950 [Parasponia andersonii]|uniref:Uncharacterized protein n=1 Tax=Parasponia andersonii TaxID=3476 RepID=A0A2P5ASF3_PARAD|nr:hypothetical protein PanWU01x14_304950 [Parasponia andersonii]
MGELVISQVFQGLKKAVELKRDYKQVVEECMAWENDIESSLMSVAVWEKMVVSDPPEVDIDMAVAMAGLRWL